MRKRNLILGLMAAAGMTAVLFCDKYLQAVKSPEETLGKTILEQENTGRESPRAALTFDDGPSKKYTPLLLDGLKERGVKASFFLLGRNIEGNEALVLRMYEEGHLIGNHTYDHVQLTKTDQKEAQMQIEKTGNRIYEITGEYPIFLRPPFGETREDMQLAVALFNVPWNVDTLDWKTKNADSILEIVQENVKDGSIILMHDGYASSVDGALAVVDYLQKEGYELVTVDRLLLV